jgi:hypothetical protein
MKKIEETPENLSLLKRFYNKVSILNNLHLDLNLWKAQNILFFIGKKLYKPIKQKAEQGDPTSREWTLYFERLATLLSVSY